MTKTKFHVLRKLSTASLAVLLTAGTIWAPGAAYAAEQGTAQSPYILQQQTLPDRLIGLHSTDQEHVISPNINTNGKSNIRVIVQLTNQPAAVGEYAAKIGLQALAAESTESAVNNQQNDVVSRALAAGINLHVNYRYNTVLNGLEVTIPANQVPKLAELDGVKSIFENNTYYTIPVQDPPSLTASQATYDASPLSLIGAQKAWQKGLTGKGVKVGVIDSGVDYDHPDLKGAYKGGYDSFDKDNDPYEAPPISVSEDPYGIGFAGTSHGTHVSGTIVGRAANKQSEIVQKGVAYEADLYVYRVLGRNPQTGRASGSSAQVIDGIEHAVKDGMNVINLSLGSDAEKSVNSPDSVAINNAVLSGVTAVIANGNAAKAGYYYYSMGSPAGAQLAISVGASTTPYNLYEASVTASVYGGAAATDTSVRTLDDNAANVNNNVYGDLSYGLSLMGWYAGQEDFASILGTSAQPGVYVGLGTDADYAGKDVKGKVVLMSRGNLTFVDKMTNARKYGAKAAIIFNGNTKPGNTSEADLSENISGRDGHIGPSAFIGEGFNYVPTFDMAGKEGRALARAALGNANGELTFTFGSNYPKTEVPGDNMADFSSRGPNQDGLLGIKPDMAAPGVGIRSSVPAYGKYIKDASYSEAYERQNGTSMASPHVAGMAVLLKQEHPNWTPFDIRAALANTADTIADQDGTPYDVYSQGAGRANVGSAVYTPAVLQTVEDITILDKNWNKTKVTNYNPSAAFGLLAAGGDAATKQLQLKNTSRTAVTYKASVKLHPSVTSNPYNPVATPDVSNITATLEGVSADSSITAAAGKTAKFALSVQASANAAEGPYEGEVVLTAAGYPTLHLPFVAQVGTSDPDSGLGLQEISVSEPVVRLNGKQDATDVRFRLLTNDTNVLELYVYDLNDEYVGTLAQMVQPPKEDGYPAFAPGYYQFSNIDNVYISQDESGKPVFKVLGKAGYKLELVAYHINSDGKVVDSSIKRAYASYRIDGTEQDRVNTAARAFNYIIDGNTVLGQSVLNLPQDRRVQYKVLSSSDVKYVDNNGVLIKYPSASYRIARLQVQISSLNDPTVQRTVHALVKITKPKK
ncbi:S8 family serine peptidase [Paenibacillus campi]|uniref:S8 family serine peptidase n=1 Tax=Paenibacillus campi TaxID=3106031 RepID=UPI002AFF487F|nr:S8 family serine peptidase [Paenibacillus sp. SGZ-1014]